MAKDDFKTRIITTAPGKDLRGDAEDSKAFMERSGFEMDSRGKVIGRISKSAPTAEPDYSVQRTSTPDGEYIVLSIDGLPCIPGASDIKALLPREIGWNAGLANRGVTAVGIATILNGAVNYLPTHSKAGKSIDPNKMPLIGDKANLERIVDYATPKQR